MNNTGKTIFIWGMAVLLGWLGPYFYAPIVSFAMIYWSALMLIALVATHFLFPNAWQNKTVQLWAVLVVVGMLENWLVTLGIIPGTYMMFSYNHFWLLLGAIGFFLTTKTWKIPKAVPIYFAAFALNLLLFVLLALSADLKVAYPLSAEIFSARWLLMGLVQGMPTIIDGFTHYNVAKKA